MVYLNPKSKEVYGPLFEDTSLKFKYPPRVCQEYRGEKQDWFNTSMKDSQLFYSKNIGIISN